MKSKKAKHEKKSKATKASQTKKTRRGVSPAVTKTVARMRKGISLRKAARKFKVSPRTVIKRAPSALRKGKSGRYAARPSDRIVRPLMIPTPGGPMGIQVRGLKQASLLGRYWSALHNYFESGDKSLQKFAGQFITATDGTKYPLLTDLDVLDNLGSAGVLSFESLYAGGTNA